MPLHSLDSALDRKVSSLFEGLLVSGSLFFYVSFLLRNSALLCEQNRIFVDMLYFLGIAVLSPILSTKRLSTTSLIARVM